MLSSVKFLKLFSQYAIHVNAEDLFCQNIILSKGKPWKMLLTRFF